MADITVTPSGVQIDSQNKIHHVFAGEAVDAGELVFRSGGVDGLYHLVDIDAIATAPEDLDGSEYAVAVNTAAVAGQPLAVGKSGAVMTFSDGSMATNTLYYGSTNPGKIADSAPGSGDFGVSVGFALNSVSISLNFQGSGVATA